MIFFYLSNVSHLHHYYRCCELYDTIAVTFSKIVTEFFIRQNLECISPKMDERGLKILNDLVKEVLIRGKSEDTFVFIERLIDFGGIYIAKKIASKQTMKVEYWNNKDVTNSYKLLRAKNFNPYQLLRVVKYFIKYGFILKYYRAHDSICLGVSLYDIKKWNIGIVNWESSNHPYLFSYKAKWKIRSANLLIENKIILWVVGYSILDESGFYAPSQRKSILDELLLRNNNIRIKYHPASHNQNEYPMRIQINKNYLLEELFPMIDILITDYSTALITASLNGVKTISIMDMVDINDVERYNFWKNYSIMGSEVNPILFPKNLADLIELCCKPSQKGQISTHE